MKLNEYVMRSLVEKCSWADAVNLLLEHYSVEAPCNRNFILSEHWTYFTCIEIRAGKKKYYWDECSGFYSEENKTKREGIFVYCRPPDSDCLSDDLPVMRSSI